MVTMGTLPLGRGSSWGGGWRLVVRPARRAVGSAAPPEEIADPRRGRRMKPDGSRAEVTALEAAGHDPAPGATGRLAAAPQNHEASRDHRDAGHAQDATRSRDADGRRCGGPVVRGAGSG